MSTISASHDTGHFRKAPLRARALPWFKRLCGIALWLGCAITSGAQATGGFTVDIASREAVRTFFNTTYAASDGVPMQSTANVANCIEGANSQAFRDAVLRRINWFRAMAGVPASVTFNTTYSANAQKAALMMSANDDLNHQPPSSWRCYSAAGYDGAESSNLFLGISGPEAITGYMRDPGANNSFVGHRRNMLHSPTQFMGTGDIPSQNSYRTANALYLLGDDVFNPRPPTRTPYVSWPPPGYVPYQVVFGRWSFGYPNADFSTATVTMRVNNAPITTSVMTPVNGYPIPSDSTLVWVPAGQSTDANLPRPSADTVYSVTVNNVRINGNLNNFTYAVTVFDPAVGTGTPPAATTVAATAITPNGATLNGSANPNGSATTGSFQWGTDTTYGQTTTPTALGSGSSAVAFSTPLTGLVPGRTYHYRAVASSSAGIVYGANMTFTTPALPPTATTLAATVITANGATLNGSANPNGSATTGYFQWGTDTTYGQTTTPTALGSGSSAVALSRALSGLVPGRTYHYRAVASSSAGIVYGANMTFTTPTPPTATTLAATVITANGATLNGSANPNGSATTGYFQWGTDTTYGQTTTPTALGSGSSAVAFSRALTGLVPGRTYHYRAVANSSAGTVYGANMTFTTTPAPMNFSTVSIPGLQGVFDSDLAWGDYDSDGRLDFLLIGNDSLQHSTTLWRNTGTGFSIIPVPGLKGVSQGSVAWIDYNNDGRLDFFIAGNAGETNLSQLWRNTGSGFANVPMPGLPQLHDTSVAWADYDNDGRPDFLLSGNTGSPNAGNTNLSQLWRNTGSGFTQVSFPDLPNVSFGDVAWADYDKDGRMDFFITGYTGSNSVSQLWRNTGSGFANVPIAGMTGLLVGSVAWGDYNNDGRMDLLITGQSTNLAIAEVWQNTGAGFINVPIPGLYGVAYGAGAWGDADNDGRLDFLLTGYGVGLVPNCGATPATGS